MEGVFKMFNYSNEGINWLCLFCSSTIFLNILRAQHAKKNIIMCLNLHCSLFSNTSTMEKHFKIRHLEQSNWLWGKSISMYIYNVYIHKLCIQYKKLWWIGFNGWRSYCAYLMYKMWCNTVSTSCTSLQYLCQFFLN